MATVFEAGQAQSQDEILCEGDARGALLGCPVPYSCMRKSFNPATTRIRLVLQPLHHDQVQVVEHIKYSSTENKGGVLFARCSR